jgi:hypothetical protein
MRAGHSMRASDGFCRLCRRAVMMVVVCNHSVGISLCRIISFTSYVVKMEVSSGLQFSRDHGHGGLYKVAG